VNFSAKGEIMESRVIIPISSILTGLAKTLPAISRSTAKTSVNSVQIDIVDRDCRERWPVIFRVTGSETDSTGLSRQAVIYSACSRWIKVIETSIRLAGFNSGQYTTTDAVSIITVKTRFDINKVFLMV
jgi:hypothetical protein